MDPIRRQLCDALYRLRETLPARCDYGDGCWRPRQIPDPWCDWCIATKALRDAGRVVSYKAPPEAKP